MGDPVEIDREENCVLRDSAGPRGGEVRERFGDGGARQSRHGGATEREAWKVVGRRRAYIVSVT